MLDLAVRLNNAVERHPKVLNAIALSAMVLLCAHYARFIRLPEILLVPVVATGLLTGVRYALWNGWLKSRIEARTREINEER